jgi:serine phosphatase RsbU (regulator of sigma subunit)
LEVSLEVSHRSDLFSSCVSIGRSSVFSVESGNRSTFRSIYSDLWNEELYDSVSNWHDKALTIENANNGMEHKMRMRRDISAEIKLISSHFNDMLNSLALIDFLLIDAILSRASLKIKSEDSLYDFIMRGIHARSDLFELFCHVHSEFVSVS